MNQKSRIIIAVALIVVISLTVLGVDALQRRQLAAQAPTDMPPGSVPIFVAGTFTKSFVPDDLSQLPEASFVDAEEGKTQAGWLLKDILALYVAPDVLQAQTEITVSSSSREKSVSLTWEQVENANNMIMFDLSGRGTLKLVSQLPGFDTRDDWVQDTDRIEVTQP